MSRLLGGGRPAGLLVWRGVEYECLTTYAYGLADQFGKLESVLLSSRGELCIATDLAREVVHRFAVLNSC